MEMLAAAGALVSLAFPGAAPIFSTLNTIARYIGPGSRFIKAAVTEGPGLYHAVVANTPELRSAVGDLAKMIFKTDNPDAVQLENVSRGLYGFQPMTHEEQMAWMERSTPSSHAP